MRRHCSLALVLFVSLCGCTKLKGMVNVNGSSGGSSSSPAASTTTTTASAGSAPAAAPEQELDDQGRPPWKISEKQIVVIEALPGKPKAKPLKAPWCKDALGHKAQDPVWLKDYLAFDEKKNEWPLDNWTKGAMIVCGAPDSDTAKTQAGYIVQLWVNRWDLTIDEAIADITASVAFDDAAEKAHKEQCDGVVAADAPLGEWAVNQAVGYAYGCKDNKLDGYKGRDDKDPVGILARVPRHPSAIARLALVDHCLSHDFEPETADKSGATSDAWHIADYLTCAPIFDQVDRKAILAELDARKAWPWARISTLEKLGDVRRRMAVGEQVFQRMAKKDKDWNALRDAAKKRYTAWVEEYGAAKDVFATAFAVDDALASDSKKTRQGCNVEPVKKAVDKMIADGHPKTVDDLAALFNRPVINMLTQRIVACYEVRGENQANLMYSWGLRAAQVKSAGTLADSRFAMIVALGELRSDREKALDGVDITYAGGFTYGASSVDKDDRAAKVGKVSAKGDQVEVAFAPEMVDVESCDKEVETHKIDRIDDDGKIRYQTRCLHWKKEKVNVAPKALTIPKAMATGLATGTYAQMLRLAGGDKGVPLVVYADKAGKNVVAVGGLSAR